MLSQNLGSVRKDMVFQYGDKSDGAIEFVGIVKGGLVEVGYFYGDNKPKNILVISTQVGCGCGCKFCSMGNSNKNDQFVRNLNSDEMFEQVVLALQVAKEYSIDIAKVRHKINFAKSGEPLLNPNIASSIKRLGSLGFSMKLSTVFPRGGEIKLEQVSEVAKNLHEPIQLQVSLISTEQEKRNSMVSVKLASFEKISKASMSWFNNGKFKRKVNLSLMLTEDARLDRGIVEKFFPPNIFRFRLRNYMPNQNGDSNHLKTIAQEKYEKIAHGLDGLGHVVEDWATPSPMEQRFGLASNVTLSRYLKIINKEI